MHHAAQRNIAREQIIDREVAKLERRKRPALFGTLPTIGGYDVIDNDTGRTVEFREDLREANGVAQFLNKCASEGTLQNALMGR